MEESFGDPFLIEIWKLHLYTQYCLLAIANKNKNCCFALISRQHARGRNKEERRQNDVKSVTPCFRPMASSKIAKPVSAAALRSYSRWELREALLSADYLLANNKSFRSTLKVLAPGSLTLIPLIVNHMA